MQASRRWRPSLPLLLFVAATGCSSPQTDAQQAPRINVPIPAEASATDRRRLESLRDRIAQEVGEARAPSAAQCRVLPLGSKPCGGPWTYVAYSASTSDSTRLQRVAAEFNAEQDRINKALGLASTCDFMMPPEVELVGGLCRSAAR